MNTLKNAVIFIFLATSGLTLLAQNHTTQIREDFKRYFDLYQVEGTIVIYDQNSHSSIIYNPDRSKQLYLPASTFKICNSLIALETGVIDDESQIISWDGVQRQIQNWNSDHNMKTAFKNSTVWFYQELARRIGAQQMKYWLETIKYGNADITGGIDRFWLTGELKISPEQQIEFLRRLNNNHLPFSQRSMDVVKKIMVVTETPVYTIKAKTGWGRPNNQDIGWYVGWVETSDNVYYFACCIHPGSSGSNFFGKARIEIVNSILSELKITE